MNKSSIFFKSTCYFDILDNDYVRCKEKIYVQKEKLRKYFINFLRLSIETERD